ncbi:DUF3343 domain-containing protein [Butyricicoccus sp. Marseille-Q5471]|uniref:DUF3343 domain-containing protein n=1 Tax=Butyricicoccus sp. Marseille-Q5471 TaxID=3039493 RepID=UPI0024BCE1E7|nr:DUF3343 domain-containing protein [Butyricicoccus sp. Marseille-Q5471]
MRNALLICRSQTEAMGLRRHLLGMGITAEVTRPPRKERTESCSFAVRVPSDQAEDAVRYLRKLGISPCRVAEDGGSV